MTYVQGFVAAAPTKDKETYRAFAIGHPCLSVFGVDHRREGLREGRHRPCHRAVVVQSPAPDQIGMGQESRDHWNILGLERPQPDGTHAPVVAARQSRRTSI